MPCGEDGSGGRSESATGGQRWWTLWIVRGFLVTCALFALYFLIADYREFHDRTVPEFLARATTGIARLIVGDEEIQQRGSAIVTHSWHIRLVRKCTGHDLLAVTFSVLVTAPVILRRRIIGLCIFLPLFTLLNLIRVVSLVVASVSSVELAWFLDEVVWTIVIVGIWLILVSGWLRRARWETLHGAWSAGSGGPELPPHAHVIS